MRESYKERLRMLCKETGCKTERTKNDVCFELTVRNQDGFVVFEAREPVEWGTHSRLYRKAYESLTKQQQ